MTRTRKDWLKWAAMGFALVATFHAEYTLAVASGMHAWVALAVPGALDAYVVRTLVRSREVLTAVLAMVAVNVCSHLVTAGVLTVGWPIIAAVSAIAPLVLWRVHALGTPGEWRERKIWDVPETPEHAGTVSVPAEPASEHDVNVGPVTSEWDRHTDQAVSVAMPDYVPKDWSRSWNWRAHSGPVPAPTEHEWDGTVTVDKSVPARWPHGEPGSETWLAHYSTPGVVPPLPEDYEHVVKKAVDNKARALKSVPPLPEGYVLADLTPADMEHMEKARVLDSEHRARRGEPVPVRVLKNELGTGTPRAQRLRAALKAEHDKSTGGTP